MGTHVRGGERLTCGPGPGQRVDQAARPLGRPSRRVVSPRGRRRVVTTPACCNAPPAERALRTEGRKARPMWSGRCEGGRARGAHRRRRGTHRTPAPHHDAPRVLELAVCVVDASPHNVFAAAVDPLVRAWPSGRQSVPETCLPGGVNRDGFRAGAMGERLTAIAAVVVSLLGASVGGVAAIIGAKIGAEKNAASVLQRVTHQAHAEGVFLNGADQRESGPLLIVARCQYS